MSLHRNIRSTRRSFLQIAIKSHQQMVSIVSFSCGVYKRCISRVFEKVEDRSFQYKQRQIFIFLTKKFKSYFILCFNISYCIKSIKILYSKDMYLIEIKFLCRNYNVKIVFIVVILVYITFFCIIISISELALIWMFAIKEPNVPEHWSRRKVIALRLSHGR